MKYVIQDTTLTAIGDAIREKGGTTDLIPVVDLADAITNLPSGGASVDFTNLKSVSYTGDYGSTFIPIEAYSALPQDFGFPAFVYVYGIELTAQNTMGYSKGLSGVAMLYTDENNEVKVKPLTDASAHESDQPFTGAAEYHYINRYITAKNSTTYFRGKAKNSVFNITVFYTPKA